MSIIGIIPARMESSRFPGKPMAMIEGIPMIGHVYLRSKMCKIFDEVYVATCNTEIADYIDSIGGQAIMTANTHERACDRASEAMLKIEAKTGEKVDILAMIQGDEPLLIPEMLEDAVTPLNKNKELLVSNLMANIKTREEHDDPNEVKVVVDKNDCALYFSREPIPSWKKSSKDVKMLKQLGIIIFRRDFLIKFNEMPQSSLEIIESVDMLRCLENNYPVKMICTAHDTYSVDTKEDLDKVAIAMQDDKLFKQYKLK